MDKIKVLRLSDGDYLFQTIDELVAMLKDEHEVTLHIREKGKIKKQIVRL